MAVAVSDFVLSHQAVQQKDLPALEHTGLLARAIDLDLSEYLSLMIFVSEAKYLKALPISEALTLKVSVSIMASAFR